ncbi:MAG: serine/threonine-protein kinase [Holophagales bacterium]|nr:serine/threonine-protein kinase [Holophagales bacterium]
MEAKPPRSKYDPPTPTLVSAGSTAGEGREAGRPLAPGETVGRYTVLEHLGTGGMGRVYAAYDPRLDRKIALKLLRPFSGTAGRDRRARLLREARALARLNDPHVLTLYDVGTLGDQVFLAMEYVPGTDLGRWLGLERRSLEEILHVFHQAGKGLVAAHEAGLVHRDFKLGNVMVRPDGRALVVDFGLARRERSRIPSVASAAGAGREPPPEAARAEPSRSENAVDGSPPVEMSAPLTGAGARLGTPLFMAPEQWEGRPAGPEADQFAFCVALYIALYGEPPFEQPERHDPPPRWAVRPPSATGGRTEGAAVDEAVPSRIRGILVKGLSIRPEDRYPSMRRLLDELTAGPDRRSRHLAVAVLVALFVGLVLWRPWDRQGPCTGGSERLTTVWSEERRDRLEASLAATGRPYSLDVSRSVGDRLDAYARSWLGMYRDACESTHLRAEQSHELLDRRMACLDQRRRELGALVALVIDEPEAAVEGAVSAVERLPALEACADTAALLSVTEPPADPAERQAIGQLRDRLARVEALLIAGRYDRAAEQVRELSSEAESRGYLPLLAEVLVTWGTVQSHKGEADAAVATLERALRVAQAAHHDRPAAEAFVRLVWVVGFEQARLEQARELEKLAGGMVAALDRGEDLEAALADHLGVLALQRGDYAAAADLHQRALVLRRLQGAGGGPVEASTLIRLGNVHLEEGELGKAEARYAEALEVQLDTLGGEHPTVATTLDRLGAVAHQTGRLSDAHGYFDRALEIQRKVFGDGHARLATTLANLANVVSSEGDPTRALELYDQVLPIYTREYGPDHPRVGIIWINISAVRNQLDDFAGSVEAAGRALPILESTYGEEHPLVAQVLAREGEALNELGRFERAELLLHRALEIQRRAYEGDHPLIGHTLVSLGRSELGLGRARDAADRLEQALYLWRTQETDPAHLAWARWMLARALEGLEPERAVKLAEVARNGFEDAAGDHSETLEEIRAWLAAR